MKKTTTLQKMRKYERWMMNPSYIEQAYKGERLYNKLLNQLGFK
jgi:cystathionine beta-lyase family protein involved in aluminum resistance